MQSRKKMALFLVRNTHDLVWTTCGKDGMLPFDLASGALIKSMYYMRKHTDSEA